MYRAGGLGRKILSGARGVLLRLRDALRASSYDLIVVQREAIQLERQFEGAFAPSRAKLVFDFDDAIWILDASVANRRLA